MQGEARRLQKGPEFVLAPLPTPVDDHRWTSSMVMRGDGEPCGGKTASMTKRVADAVMAARQFLSTTATCSSFRPWRTDFIV
jgi:hypothetical protein